MIYLSDNIVIIGGKQANTVSETVELIDGRGVRLPTRLESMIERRDELGVTLGLDGKIYAVGGFNGN